MFTKDKSKFVSVSGESLINFLRSAKQRVIAAKPGYVVAEIQELLNLSKSKRY